MSKIHIMPDVLASQVAAGEVVERPASVIKELVENSLDASAKSITVEITRGGLSSMRVADDGNGMSREDALLSIERHATSKLLTINDLFEISHLGFRGEALPSIASVARMKIKTRERESIEGWEIAVEGGVMHEPRSCGMSPGTSIEVSDLFFNTPARRKFLKSEETEAAHIEHQLRLHALAFPRVRFSFRKNGQMSLDLPAAADARVRIAALTDTETASNLVAIQPHYGPGITVHGYLLPLSMARRTRKGQFIFLNKRPVEDKLITRAIRDGYGGLPNGQHPALYLYIDIEPALVDVNVHPAKREVRFRRPTDIVTTVIDAISSTLAAHSKKEINPEAPVNVKPGEVTPADAPSPVKTAPTPPDVDKSSESGEKTGQAQQPIAPFKTVSPVKSIKPLPAVQRELIPRREHGLAQQPPFPFRLIGTLKGKYGLFENEDGLAVMYPRAARERIIFEKMLQGRHAPLASQTLLEPLLLEVDPRDYDILVSLKNHFEKAGIILSPFGQRTIRVEAIPPVLHPSDTKAFILDLVDRVTHSEFSKKASHIAFETFAEILAKRSARHEKIDLTHALGLLKELLQCEVPYCTPSGKPTLVMYSTQEIGRKFGLV